MKWPRCNFKFFTYDTPDTKTWRLCQRAWGHWMIVTDKSTYIHMGPIVPPGRVPRRMN